MRKLTLFAAIACTGLAFAAKPGAAAAPPAPVAVEVKSFEVKTFEPKELGLDAIEIKAKDVDDATLDRRLATKKTKTVGGEASVMRAPAKPAILEATEAASEGTEAEAPVAAPSNKKDPAGSR